MSQDPTRLRRNTLGQLMVADAEDDAQLNRAQTQTVTTLFDQAQALRLMARNLRRQQERQQRFVEKEHLRLSQIKQSIWLAASSAFLMGLGALVLASFSAMPHVQSLGFVVISLAIVISLLAAAWMVSRDASLLSMLKARDALSERAHDYETKLAQVKKKVSDEAKQKDMTTHLAWTTPALNISMGAPSKNNKSTTLN